MVTIFECQTPWRADIGTEWTRRRVAQMRSGVDDNLWTLYLADHNGRWYVFNLIDPGPISELLDQIELDRTAIFWG